MELEKSPFLLENCYFSEFPSLVRTLFQSVYFKCHKEAATETNFC